MPYFYWLSSLNEGFGVGDSLKCTAKRFVGLTPLLTLGVSILRIRHGDSITHHQLSKLDVPLHPHHPHYNHHHHLHENDEHNLNLMV